MNKPISTVSQVTICSTSCRYQNRHNEKGTGTVMVNTLTVPELIASCNPRSGFSFGKTPDGLWQDEEKYQPKCNFIGSATSSLSFSKWSARFSVSAYRSPGASRFGITSTLGTI